MVWGRDDLEYVVRGSGRFRSHSVCGGEVA